MKSMIEMRNVKVHFKAKSHPFKRSADQIKAVDDVSLRIDPGKVLGLVGESGSGKTTLGRALLCLTPLTSGTVYFQEREIRFKKKAELKKLRRQMQIVFQDPNGSLNPRMRIGDFIREPLEVHKIGNRSEQAERVAELLRMVELPNNCGIRYPHELSGGQRQRVSIARALASAPQFIVADEPVSALDVSVQAQVINLLADLKKRLQMTLLFISHDLAVVQHLSDEIAVMYLGRIVEQAGADEIFARPCHPYTEALLNSVPIPDPRSKNILKPLEGDIPSPMNPPSGCVFRTRCPKAIAECGRTVPELRSIRKEHSVACLLG